MTEVINAINNYFYWNIFRKEVQIIQYYIKFASNSWYVNSVYIFIITQLAEKFVLYESGEASTEFITPLIFYIYIRGIFNYMN